jgi:murein DD-endopeptidase MepM/ murein hydrolase activator NlpD
MARFHFQRVELAEFFKKELGLLTEFYRAFQRYAHKRLLQAWTAFEARKDLLVGFLVAKRGTYARPFMHTSLFVLIAVAITAAPVIKNTYESQAATDLSAFQPPSAVLSSFEAQETITQISEKPRDHVLDYTIQDGDTLSRIAGQYNVSVDTLKWANPDLNGEQIKPGGHLNIPPVTGVVVKVRKGDTIYSLAKKYNSEAQNIVNFPFNDFTDLDTFALAVGQQLVIPDGEIAAPAAPLAPKIPSNIATGPAPVASGNFLWPTNGIITQYPVSYHMAFDIANNALPPVMAADSGTVTIPPFDRYGYGNHVMINHGNGYITNYAHLSQILVSEGQTVTKGQVIGRMGSTGRSTGPHLHFEIRRGNVLLNPAQFFRR